MSPPPPRILVIGGSDPSGGAGIQADIKTITMLGGYAMTAITAVTVQNTHGVSAANPLPAALVAEQIDACLSDIGADAVKIGMLGTAETAAVVADRLEHFAGPVVFDPVMVATNGGILAGEGVRAAFEALIARATLTTPNLPELAALGGEAALLGRARALLVKGGHGEGDDIEDVLLVSGCEYTYLSKRIATRHTHGTGCTLASAIATGLGAGLALDVAVERGIAFVQAALAAAPGLGGGHGPLGHTLNQVAFYQALEARDADGWRAGDFAAKWS